MLRQHSKIGVGIWLRWRRDYDEDEWKQRVALGKLKGLLLDYLKCISMRTIKQLVAKEQLDLKEQCA